MRDFYAHSAAAPLDQADGLRRLFVGPSQAVIALAANAQVPLPSLVLERIALRLAALGRRVLIVDAAASASALADGARLDLAAGVEPVAPGVAYLAARGLPLAYVDTRGHAARFIDALHEAVPHADALLLHAEAHALMRVLAGRAARPLVMAADHPESLKLAYAACKLLAHRTGLRTFDFLLAASARSPRLSGIVASLSGCIENFLGGLLAHWALVDPAGDAEPPEASPLTRLLRLQLELDPALPAPPPAMAPAQRPAFG
jgi:flagellar biosynthesis protein FlhG